MTHEPIRTPGGLLLTRDPNENQWSVASRFARATYAENPSYCGASWSLGDHMRLHSGRSREDCIAWLDAQRAEALASLLPPDAEDLVARKIAEQSGIIWTGKPWADLKPETREGMRVLALEILAVVGYAPRTVGGGK